MKGLVLRLLVCMLVGALGPAEALAKQADDVTQAPIGEPGTGAAPEQPPLVESPSAGGAEDLTPPSPPEDSGMPGTSEASGLASEVPPAPPRPEDEDWLKHRIELIDELTLVDDADSLFNPGGEVLAIESRNNALRLNAELKAELPADLVVKGQVSSALTTGRETLSFFSVRELYTTASLGNFELSVGRKILRWTNGYAFNPAGLLEPRRVPSDPQDRLRLLKGLEMVQLDYFAGDHVFTAVFSSDALTNEEEARRRYDLALRANVLVPAWNLDLAIIALGSNIKNTGALTFNYVLGDALELHGEVSGTRGTSAQYPQSILPGNQSRLFVSDFLAQLKEDEPRLFLRYVLGVNYTLPTGTNLIGEFYHTDEGLSAEEWARFLEHADFGREQLATRRHPPVFGGLSLPAVNLLQGLRQLGGQNIRRNYLFLRASQSWLAERVVSSVLTIVNLDDRGAAFVGEGSYLFRRGATLYARATVLTGNSRSEFGNVGQRASLNLGMLLSF
jgi:hypothetical protein